MSESPSACENDRTVPDSRTANKSSIDSDCPRCFARLRHRNFQFFFGGQLISLIGTWMQNVAQSWLVYRMTGRRSSSAWSASPGKFRIPVRAAGRNRRGSHGAGRRVVIATQTVSMLLAFILAVLTLIRVRHRLGNHRARGVARRGERVRHSRAPGILMDMVGREDLMNAIALNSSMFNGARVVGPAVAGILVAWIGEGWCFFANAVSYIAVIVGLLMMRLARPSGRNHGVAVRTHRRRLPLRAAARSRFARCSCCSAASVCWHCRIAC